jgi:replication factor C subunit 1
MSRLKSICGHEELKSDDNMLRKLIESSGSDLRQIINVLQMWKNQSVTLGKDFMSFMAKDEKVMMNNFDAASKLLNLGDVRNTTKYPTYRSKMDLFFIDHEFVPLLVQENYLNA